MNPQVLLVDDNRNLLDGCRRQLCRSFAIDVAEGGPQALERIRAGGAYAVVISDMQMPEMSGVDLLEKVRTLLPDAARIMLTGNADQKTAVDAVNQGRIFRFLSKPCSVEDLAASIRAGVEHHRLLTAEKEVLTKTLSGAISLMTEMLAVANPAAHGRASRVRRLTHQLCEKLRMPEAWEIEIAAMLSQIGFIAVPDSVMSRFQQRLKLSAEEQVMINDQAKTGRALVARIPRLERAAEMIGRQQERFDTTAAGQPAPEVLAGARLLKLALDYDALMQASGPGEALRIMHQDRDGWYDPAQLAALESLIDGSFELRAVRLAELREGMVLDENVCTISGDLLISTGHEVTVSLIRRLENFASRDGVRQPIRVRCPQAAGELVGAGR